MRVFFKLIIALFFCAPLFAQQSDEQYNDSVFTYFDYAPDESDSLLEARINSIDAEMPLIFNAQIRAFIDMFTLNRRDYTRRVIARQNIYFHIFEEALERHNMPDDLKYLTIVESAIRPTAKSRVGALGLWQFMPATGKMYGLTYNYYTDKRMDPYLATDAACKYLKLLHTMFGDWQVALAAYNCGPGNVRKAIRRSGNKRTFDGIYGYLPKETRGYVSIFMAVNYVFRFHDEHNIFTEKKGVKYSYFEHEITSLVNLNVLADSLGVCKDEIAFLNPQIKQDIIPAGTQSFNLRLPLNVKDQFSTNPTHYISSANVAPVVDPAEQVVAIRYKVRRGDNLGKIADKHGVGLSQLKSWNNIGRNNIIHTGQYLTIHTKAKNTTEKVVTATTVNKNLSTFNSTTYTVRSGDAVSTIAERFNISLGDLKAWNGIGSQNLIKEGQVLRVSKEVSQVSITKSIAINEVYIVEKGDTLWSISKKIGTTVDNLKKYNNLSNTSLKVGQKIRTSM